MEPSGDLVRTPREVVVMQRAQVLLDTVLKAARIDAGHGIEHAMRVLNHMEHALRVHPRELTDNQRVTLKLAALLHDADDSKFFNSKNYENVRSVLADCLQKHPDREEITAETISAIDLVSCSKNLNNVVDAVDQWKLLVRWCDRLESMGKIGLYRAYEYTRYKHRPLYIDTTPRPTNEKELQTHISYERFANYPKIRESVSMVDHFYDKNLFLIDMTKDCPNSYINYVAGIRHAVTVKFLIDFGIHGEVDTEKIVREAELDYPR